MRILLLTILIHLVAFVQAQVIHHPNIGQKSHPTIHIEKIVHTTTQTKLYMNAVNKASGGDNLCISADTYLQNSLGGNKYTLLQSEGLPLCPDQYRFMLTDERLDFVLIFPRIDDDIPYFDLIEPCNEFCIRFEGIINQSDLNGLLNDGYQMYQEHRDADALALFETAVSNYPDYPYGFIHLNIIKIYADQNDWDAVKEWYSALNAPHLKDSELMREIVKSDYLRN